jgi:CheY-like chemotaxis protein
MLRRVIGDTISLRTVIERRVGTVRADPSQIEQLLLNLVVNARDAMPTGGRITIALQQRTGEKSLPNNGEQGAEWAEVSVTDEGTGIPPEVQRRMFEPFFTTKRPGQGTGLGLATCVMIAQQNHGRLEFTTAPAKGTTFSLLLPCVPEAATAPRLPREELSAPGHETLLVVEDEPAVGEIMALLLRDLGYNVITAENGEAAERAIAECEREIDLVLTDLNMPRMNGRELLERLSRNNPRVRVILTSGDQDLLDEEKEQSLEVDFLPKPFTRQGLAEKVRTVLEK